MPSSGARAASSYGAIVLTAVQSKGDVTRDLGDETQPFELASGSVGSPRLLTQSPETDRYEIRASHARGGLGDVFRAVDHELNRTVALKTVQEQFVNDKGCRQRFLFEGHVTGNLEHPGIVPVYSLDRGPNPFYAMRFIDGESLGDAIQRLHASPSSDQKLGVSSAESIMDRSLELRRLVERLRDVCNTIAYAHSMGVVHRDLKPANIMIGSYGETLVVDWGLAKLVGSDRGFAHSQFSLTSTEDMDQTRAGSILGTPTFMSPEQAVGSVHDVNEQSDVYSIGVILYHILTGQTPFPQRTVEAVLQNVRDGRFVSPNEVKANIPKPLGAICSKAMSLCPSDRYNSAKEVAQDLERWSAEEPVSAWPEPLLVRTRRYLRKHRTVVASTAAALCVAFMGLFVLSLVQAQANTKLRSLSESERLAKVDALKQLDVSLKAIRQFHSGVAEEWLLSQPGFESLRANLLKGPRQFYAELTEVIKQSPAYDESPGSLVDAYAQWGEIAYMVNAHEEADTAFTSVVNLTASGNPSLARALAQDRLGDIAAERGQLDVAQSAYLEAHQTYERLSAIGEDVHLHHAESMKHLAVIYAETDRTDQAVDLFESVLKQLNPPGQESMIHDMRHIVVMGEAYNSYGNSLDKQSNAKGAEHAYREALEVFRWLDSKEHNHPRVQTELAKVLSNLGILYSKLGNKIKSEEHYQESLKIWATLLRRWPNVLSIRSGTAKGKTNLGSLLLRDRNRLDEAEELIAAGVQEFKQLCAEDSSAPQRQADLAMSQVNLAMIYKETDRLPRAESLYKETIQVLSTLLKDHPDTSRYMVTLGATQVNLGLLQTTQENYVAAQDSLDHAIDTLTSAGIESDARIFLSRAYRARAAVMTQLQEFGDAESDWAASVRSLPGTPTPLFLIGHGNALARINQKDKALELLASAMQSERIRPHQMIEVAGVYAMLYRATRQEKPVDEASLDTLLSLLIASLDRCFSTGFLKLDTGKQMFLTDPNLIHIRGVSEFDEFVEKVGREASK